MKNYQLYVRREIQNQSSLRHPLIVSLREACPSLLSFIAGPHPQLETPKHLHNSFLWPAYDR